MGHKQYGKRAGGATGGSGAEIYNRACGTTGTRGNGVHWKHGVRYTCENCSRISLTSASPASCVCAGR